MKSKILFRVDSLKNIVSEDLGWEKRHVLLHVPLDRQVESMSIKEHMYKLWVNLIFYHMHHEIYTALLNKSLKILTRMLFSFVILTKDT